jgi:hypothetical protein
LLPGHAEQVAGGKDRALILAAFLEAVSVHVDGVPEALRVEGVRTSEWLDGGSAAVRF